MATDSEVEKLAEMIVETVKSWWYWQANLPHRHGHYHHEATLANMGEESTAFPESYLREREERRTLSRSRTTRRRGQNPLRGYVARGVREGNDEVQHAGDDGVQHQRPLRRKTRVNPPKLS